MWTFLFVANTGKCLGCKTPNQVVPEIQPTRCTSELNLRNRKSKYCGMKASDLKRMKKMEHELSQFERM